MCEGSLDLPNMGESWGRNAGYCGFLGAIGFLGLGWLMTPRRREPPRVLGKRIVRLGGKKERKKERGISWNKGANSSGSNGGAGLSSCERSFGSVSSQAMVVYGRLDLMYSRI